MELKKYKDCKFIVSSGCSYGMIPKAVIKPFNLINRTSYSDAMDFELYKQYGKNWLEIDEDIIVINTSLGSQGSDWQSDSIIYTIEKLIELGVKTENIYSLVEWSQWNRFTTYPDSSKLDFDKFEWNRINPFFYEDISKDNLLIRNNEISSELYNILKLRTSIPFYNVGKIQNRVYITSSVMDVKDFNKVSKEYGDFIISSKKIHDQYPTDKKIKDYLNNILKTQFFLKSKNIKYNFCFMQSSLSNWYNKHNTYNHILTPPFISETESFKDYGPNKDFNPINDINTDVENVIKDSKLEMSLIDMQNIWFYENERFRRGGIDEWTIDNFKEIGYINLHEFTEEFFSPMDMICNYGQHPNTVSYLLLWNKITTNCDFVKVKSDFEDFMLDKFWEDYNYEGFSKNYVTISKKEWERRLKQ
jgi:hypothetical protein